MPSSQHLLLRALPLVVTLGVGAVAPGAAAAALGPALAGRLAHAAAGEEVPVVVTLRRQVDPGPYAGRPSALMAALHRAADATQPSVIDELDGPVRRFWLTNAVAARARPHEIRRLAADPAVASVDVDPPVHLMTDGRALAERPFPDPGDSAWGVRAAGAPRVWSGYGITGTGVRVGSIDTGADPGNPDLRGRIVAWRDFVAGSPVPYDDNGHGTHTLGIMVGGHARGAAVGVAPGARAVVAKAIGADGNGTGSAILAAAEWMADPDGNPATPDQPAVVNNSWGADDPNNPWFHAILRRWQELGIVGVFAAGNAGPGASTVPSPASYPEAVAVGAVDRDASVAAFSSRGPVLWSDADGTGPAAGTTILKPDVVAPGVAVASTYGGGYLAYSGSSVAAPHVSGVVALIRQASPGLPPDQVADVLRRTAADVGPPGPDAAAGFGEVRAFAAVEAVVGPPVTTRFARIPRTPARRRVLTFRVATRGTDTYRRRVDRGPWGAPTTDRLLTVRLPDGRHLIQAQAVSPTGILDPRPARHWVTVRVAPRRAPSRRSARPGASPGSMMARR